MWFSSGVRHAADFHHAGVEQGFVATVVVSDELTGPGTEEGTGMVPCTAFGKVVHHGGHSASYSVVP
jgi:hypothetical protein